jgi:UDP-N-acetylmuramate-alanine ligase
VFHRKRLAPEELLDRDAVVAELARRGVAAVALPDDEDPLPHVRRLVLAGDVVVSMSSGDFGGLPRRLLAALQEQG